MVNKLGRIYLLLSLCVVLVAPIGIPFSSTCSAQQNGPQPGVSYSQYTEAVTGTPYGVARIYWPAGQVTPNSSVRLIVSNPESRIFFPAVDTIPSEPKQPEKQPVGDRPRIAALVQRIRQAVNAAKDQIDPPELLRIQFLFTGTNPLKVVLSGDVEHQFEITPITTGAANNPGPKYADLHRSWWDGYVAQLQKQVERSDYPSIIENYLVYMLGNRFGFPTPNLVKDPKTKKKPQTDPLPTIELIAGIESLRAELHRETLAQPRDPNYDPTAIPLAPKWLDHHPPAVPVDLPIEKIATHVPSECFYVRFGSFANFMWFKDFGNSRGGDVAQLAIIRGLNYRTNVRLERMLNTKTTVIGKLFGDSIISDMAIIGQDLYLQDGPSMGVLFEAKNIALLRSSMQNDRNAAIKQYPDLGAKLDTLEVKGKKVSLLSTPDNQIRSFMVEDGNYLLITSSRKIAERFLEVSNGAPSLADSPSFRFARLTMPLSSEYSIFAYLSSEFFRNLVSPQYQIELRRRLKAIASIELAEIATQVAKAEEKVLSNTYAKSIEDLVAGGYLPPSFQDRFDGSQTLKYRGSWHDSLRGARGSFLPIADVELQDCTREEAAAYIDQASFYATKWQQTDPLMVGIRRFTDEQLPNVEKLVIEGYIAPLGREKYGWLSSMLGAPRQTTIELPPDDIIHLQGSLSGESPLGRQALDHLLFAGIKDLVPPIPGETKGLLATLRLLKSIPGYVGTCPSPGYLDRLPFGLGGGIPDAYGYSRTLFGLWRWQGSGFSIISFDRSIVDQCVSMVRPVEEEDFAQARLQIGDLKNSRVASFFNILSYRRAAQASRGNLMLLDVIQSQLQIAPEDSLKVAESLLDAKLQCSLGGKYELFSGKKATDRPSWTSTAWANSIAAYSRNPGMIGFDNEHAMPTANYRVPWLEWFRGAHLHLTQLPERLVLVGSVSMERLAPTETESTDEGKQPELPKMNLDVFSLPFQFFQGDKPKAGKQEEEKPKPQRRDF
ncbi:MAG: hypothetical protein ACK56W_02645 [Pirellula sp.]